MVWYSLLITVTFGDLWIATCAPTYWRWSRWETYSLRLRAYSLNCLCLTGCILCKLLFSIDIFLLGQYGLQRTNLLILTPFSICLDWRLHYRRRPWNHREWPTFEWVIEHVENTCHSWDSQTPRNRSCCKRGFCDLIPSCGVWWRNRLHNHLQSSVVASQRTVNSQNSRFSKSINDVPLLDFKAANVAAIIRSIVFRDHKFTPI